MIYIYHMLILRFQLATVAPVEEKEAGAVAANADTLETVAENEVWPPACSCFIMSLIVTWHLSTDCSPRLDRGNPGWNRSPPSGSIRTRSERSSREGRGWGFQIRDFAVIFLICIWCCKFSSIRILPKSPSLSGFLVVFVVFFLVFL